MCGLQDFRFLTRAFDSDLGVKLGVGPEIAGDPLVELTEPAEIRLVGVVPEDTGAGGELSQTLLEALPHIESAVLAELERLGVRVRPRRVPGEPDLWWKRREAAPEVD